MDLDAYLEFVRELTHTTVERLSLSGVEGLDNDSTNLAANTGGLGPSRLSACSAPSNGIDTTLVAGMFSQVIMEANNLPATRPERVSLVRKKAKYYLVNQLAGQITLSQFYRLLNIIEEKVGTYFEHLERTEPKLGSQDEPLVLPPSDSVRSEELRQSLARIDLPQKGRRKLSPETLWDFLQNTRGQWFRLLDFETQFGMNKKTAWNYLTLLHQEGILEHNGEKANRVRYVLAASLRGPNNLKPGKFNQECDHRLNRPAELPLETFISTPPPPPPISGSPPEHFVIAKERRYATVLFSDLSGLTALSEKLDHEEVKELITRISAEITKIIEKYEGYAEKLFGGAVIIFFGVPKAHEDDPVRAIWAAKEIHELVKSFNLEGGKKIGHSLRMHTGINTGFVVTGAINLHAEPFRFLGDTLNTASRLMSMGTADEIIVSPATFHQTQGYFHFEKLEAIIARGKSESISAYLLRGPKEQTAKTRRLSGLRAALTGRKAEMELLRDATAKLLDGAGTIISISGPSGTGKSRLIEEFKDTLDLSQIQWLEGSAYQYAHKIPYFPLINLLSRAWKIQEDDSPESIRAKIEAKLVNLSKDREDLIPFVGSLYSLEYPELQGINPETWKSQLNEAIQEIFLRESRVAPTVICFEDLQWADQSSVDLLRQIFDHFRGQALFILTFRPPFTLHSGNRISCFKKSYWREMQLQDLSNTESCEMVQSLLKSDRIPLPLKMLVQEISEGNPFYLEEMINAMIESGVLMRDHGSWTLSRAITRNDVPASIQEMIAAKLDRLDNETKCILQEASVIGRAFPFDVLQRVTIFKEKLVKHLGLLELLDLIKINSVKPDLEYVFKHALIQDVVYHSLLKEDRQLIHERIGLAMEEIFQNRLSEFYETLAFHFRHSPSDSRAIDYLFKSAEKSLEKYALDEAHEYFQDAFNILASKTNRTRKDDELYIDLISKWFLVFYYRGDFISLTELFSSSRELAESLEDYSRLGMFYACMAFTLFWGKERLRESYELLQKALALGEKVEDQRVIGYAATWLAWVCADLGLFDEGIRYGQMAQDVVNLIPSDQYLFFKSLAGIGHNYWQIGEGQKNIEIGKTLQTYGKKHSNVRSIVTGHIVEAAGHFALGDFMQAIKCANSGINGVADPFYDQWAKIALSMSFIFQTIKLPEAGKLLEDVLAYSEQCGCDYLKTMADLLMGVLLIAKGQMSRGFAMIEKARSSCLENERITTLGVAEYILGRIYLQLAKPSKSIKFWMLARNIGFLLANVPQAALKAEQHLLKAIEIAERIGAKGILGQAYLDLGLLRNKEGKVEEARRFISSSIDLFEPLGANVLLKKAYVALRSVH
jgi:class 3 adenylate cyclase/tetratricopeptide (TPR) repeat protein